MEREGTKINIRSKLFKEVYRLTWTIENFHSIPFLADNPLCGPCFLLGKDKDRDTTWSLLMSKEMHEGVENVGIRFVRTEDDTSWNQVTVSLFVMLEDGRLVKCVDKKVLSGELENSYVFLIKPSKSKHAFRSGMDASTQVENSRSLEGSVKDSKIETFSAINGEDKDEVNLSPKVENSRGLDGSVVPKTESCSFEDSVLKKSGELKDAAAKPEAASDSPKVEENSRSLKQQSKIETCGIEDSETKTNEDQHGDAEFMPEELLKLKKLTVVCEIEYIYMLSTKFENIESASDESDLMDVFKYLHSTGKYSDITLKCRDFHFLCHKAILGPRSRVFGELLESDSLSKPLIVNLYMEPHIGKAFILYLYTGELPEGMSAKDCRQLYHVAENFRVHGMKKSCLELMKRLEFDESCLEEQVEVRLIKTLQSLISIVSSPTEDQLLFTVARDVAENRSLTGIPDPSIDANDTMPNTGNFQVKKL